MKAAGDAGGLSPKAMMNFGFLYQRCLYDSLKMLWLKLLLGSHDLHRVA